MKRFFCPLAIGLIAAYQLTLVGQGAFSWWDELIYFISLKSVAALSDGDFTSALALFAENSRGRLGILLLWLPLAVLHLVYSRLADIPLLASESLIIPQLFNVVLFVYVLYLVKRLAFLLFNRSDGFALVAVVLVGTLANSSVYIRHIVPYDVALCLGLLSLCLVVEHLILYQRPLPLGKAFTCGVLASASFVTYPGYYFFSCFCACCDEYKRLRNTCRSRSSILDVHARGNHPPSLP